MAWIKLEHAAPDKPEVVLLARTLGVSHEAAFVNLVRVLSGRGLTRAPSWPAASGTPTGTILRTAQSEALECSHVSPERGCLSVTPALWRGAATSHFSPREV